MRKSKAIDVTEKKGVVSVSKVAAALASCKPARDFTTCAKDRGHKVFAALEAKFAADSAQIHCLDWSDRTVHFIGILFMG